MIEKLIENSNKRYNLKITYKQKILGVYFIYFVIEGKGVGFNFIFNKLISFEENEKEFYNKINKSIINHYLRKVK